MKKAIKKQSFKKQYRELEKKYALGTYKAPKTAKSVIVNGVQYDSKIQACILEGLKMSELNEFLKNNA